MAIEFHPAAEIFPLLTDAALDELVEDVRTNGLRVPIVKHPDGRILDGRNRYKACELAGVPPRFETWDGDGSPIKYVLSLNLHRRHLDTAQRAMVSGRIATLQWGEFHGNQHEGGIRKSADTTPTQTEAAEMMNVSTRAVQAARTVLKKGIQSVVDAVDHGVVAVTAAEKYVSETPTLQQMADADAGEIIDKIGRKHRPHKEPTNGQHHSHGPDEPISQRSARAVTTRLLLSIKKQIRELKSYVSQSGHLVSVVKLRPMADELIEQHAKLISSIERERDLC